MRACLTAAAAIIGLSLGAFPGPTTLRADDSPSRIVAIADVHGDVASFTAILKRAGLIDDAGHWAGGSTVLVQEGDLLDRRPDAKQVLALAMALESEAPRAGGRAIFLIGNHEAMNAMGELRDVVPATYASFVDAASESKRQAAWKTHRSLAERRRKALADASLAVPDVFADISEDAWMTAHPPGMLEYLDAFSRSGDYGRWIRGHDAIVQVGGSVFQHAGLDPAKAPSKLSDVNARVRDDLGKWDEARAYLVSRGLAAASFTFGEVLGAGQIELARLDILKRRGRADAEPVPPALDAIRDIDQSSLVEPGGPLWFRGFANWTDAEGPDRMAQLLSRYHAERFVAGHSPIKSGRITPQFEGRVILIDTGMSSFFRPFGGQPSALEIKDGRLTAIYLDSQSVIIEPGK